MQGAAPGAQGVSELRPLLAKPYRHAVGGDEGDLGGEDPLRPLLRELLECSKAGLIYLNRFLEALDAAVELQEPEEAELTATPTMGGQDLVNASLMKHLESQQLAAHGSSTF